MVNNLSDSPPPAKTRDENGPVSLAIDEGKLGWVIRISLLLLLIAAPWPFGSATPLPSGFLSAALYLLFGVWVCNLLLSERGVHFRWPAHRWLGLAVLLGLFQLLPLVPGLLKILAPAAAATHYPKNPEAHQIVGTGWRPVSIESFATETELLRLGALIAAFFLCSHLFVHRRDIRLLGYTLATLGVALSLFAVYQHARWGTVLYGRYPVPSANPFGPFVNHNHFAGFVEMCALVALGGAIGHLGRRSQTVSILLGGSALFMGVALVSLALARRLLGGGSRRGCFGHPGITREGTHASFGTGHLGRSDCTPVALCGAEQRLRANRIHRSGHARRFDAISIAAVVRFVRPRPSIARLWNRTRNLCGCHPALSHGNG